MIVQLEVNSKARDLEFFGLDDKLQDIMHVVCPELGLNLPQGPNDFLFGISPLLYVRFLI